MFKQLKHMKLKSTLSLFMMISIYSLNAQEVAFIEYYDNGNLKVNGLKTNEGTPIGAWTYYRKDNSLDMELHFNEYGKPQGPFKMYHRNGKLQIKCSYSGKGFYEMDGEYEDYYKNGQLESKGVYKENKAIGKWVKYYDSGE